MAKRRTDRAQETKTPNPGLFACHAARLLDDSKCEEVKVLDLRGLSQVTDFFVLATGTSERQIHSVADDLMELARVEGEGKPARDASPSGGWVVADFFDIVVHLFSPELRGYYDLDSLWSDAKELDWRAATKPGQFAKIKGK